MRITSLTIHKEMFKVTVVGLLELLPVWTEWVKLSVHSYCCLYQTKCDVITNTKLIWQKAESLLVPICQVAACNFQLHF